METRQEFIVGLLTLEIPAMACVQRTRN